MMLLYYCKFDSVFARNLTSSSFYSKIQKGMEARKGGDMKSAMEAAQAERAAVKAKREEKEKK